MDKYGRDIEELRDYLTIDVDRGDFCDSTVGFGTAIEELKGYIAKNFPIPNQDDFYSLFGGIYDDHFKGDSNCLDRVIRDIVIRERIPQTTKFYLISS